MSESDVYGRQILTSKDDPYTVMVKYLVLVIILWMMKHSYCESNNFAKQIFDFFMTFCWKNLKQKSNQNCDTVLWYQTASTLMSFSYLDKLYFCRGLTHGRGPDGPHIIQTPGLWVAREIKKTTKIAHMFPSLTVSFCLSSSFVRNGLIVY